MKASKNPIADSPSLGQMVMIGLGVLGLGLAIALIGSYLVHP